MAKKRNIEFFYTVVKQEGDRGATRGKVSVAMCEALGAGDGDIIEYEVDNGTIVGGHVLTKSEKKDYLREHAREAKPAKKEKPTQKKGKPVVKKKSRNDDWDDDEPRPKKKGKTSKRKTKVEYESEPTPKKKGKQKPKLSLKKKR